MSEIVNNRVLVAPSILSADFSCLGDEVREAERSGADWIHIDVMDGVFVPNITIGPLVVRSLRKVTGLVLDVHLMIESPLKYIEEFSAAGSDIITFHIEACPDPVNTAYKIRSLGKRAGVSLRPGTAIEQLKDVLPVVDMVLVMTVEPGFGGQSFIPEMMGKVRDIRKIFSGIIQVDGGINAETSRRAIDAGADVLVAGTAVFGAEDYSAAITNLRCGNVD